MSNGNIDYSERDIDKRAKQSELWIKLCKQQGESLPYLLERYLLLKNWAFLDNIEDAEIEEPTKYDISYLHLLLADAVTVLLDQEKRIRKLEEKN